MKTFIISFLFLVGTISAGNSQIKKVFDLDPIEVSAKIVNPDYLKEVQNDFVPEDVLKFQKRIAAFDIKKLLDYDESMNYEVIFKTTKGNINTIYDGDGKILWSRGSYRSIRLPKDITRKIMKENEGWNIEDDKYVSFYHSNSKDSKAQYSVYLSNENSSKKVKIEM